MRKAEIIGSLGRDGELKAVGDKSVINFSVAANGFKKDEDPVWINCALWGARADKMASFLKKGQKVFLRGEFKLRSWESNGKSGTDVDLSVDEIELVGAKKEESSSDPSNPFGR